MAKSSKNKPKVRATHKIPVLSLLVMVLCLAGTGAAAVLWVMPTASEVASVAQQTAVVEGQIAASKSRIASLEGGQSSGAQELLAQARLLDAQLPASVDKVSLVAEVPTLAASYGLTVTQMDPAAEPSATGTVSALTFSMGVSGDRDQVFAFIEKLTAADQPSKLMSVDDVALKVGDEKATATFTLAAYYSGQPPIAAPGAPAPAP